MINDYLLADPFFEDYFISLVEQRQRRVAQLKRVITPSTVRRTAALGDYYPDLSPDVVTAAGMAGVTPGGEAANALAVTSIQKDDEFWGWTFLKGAARVGFTIFDALWNETISRGFKTVIATVGLTDQGPMAPWEAYMRAGTSTGVRALAEAARGRPVNLGEGFLPQSSAATDFPLYGQLIAEGRTAEEAEAQVYATFGQPITTQAWESQNQLTRGGRSISPGRFIADFTWMEPGSTPYNLLSGSLDAMLQLSRLDPASALLRRAARGIQGARMLSYVDEALTVPGSAARATLGLLDNVPAPRVVTGRGVDFLATRGGEDWMSFLRTVGPDNISEVADLVRRYEFPPDFFRRILAGENPELVWLDLVREGRAPRVPVAGRISRAAGRLTRPLTGVEPETITVGGFGGSLRSAMARRADIRSAVSAAEYPPTGRFVSTSRLDRLTRPMPNPTINPEKLDATWRNWADWLAASGMSPERQSHYLAVYLKIPRYTARADVYRLMLKDAMSEWAGGIRDDWVRDLGIAVGGKEYKAVDRMFRQMTDVFRSEEDFTRFFTDAVGNDAFHPLARLEVTGPDGSWRVLPSPQEVTEFLQRNIILPDARKVRHALGTLRRHLVDTPGLFDGPLGAGTLTKYVVDPFMQNFWKPVTLLRVAWPVRVIGEGQLRIMASGYDAIFNHPLRALTWMVTNPNRNAVTRWMARTGRVSTGFLDEGPEILDQLDDWQNAMSGVKSRPLFGMFGDSKRRPHDWVNYPADHPQAARHLAEELRQLYRGELAPKVAELGRDDAVRWVLEDPKAGPLRRKLAASSQTKGGLGLAADQPDPELVRLVVDSMAARIYIKTGGQAGLFFDGTRLNPTDVPEEAARLINQAAASGDYAPLVGRLSWQFGRPGNRDLVNLIRTGHFDLAGDGTLIDLRNGTPRQQYADLADRLEDYRDFFPGQIKGPRDTPYGKGAEEIIDFLFRNLMSRPENFLDRSPVFRQARWRRTEELVGFMSPGLRRRVLARAQAHAPKAVARQLRQTIADFDARGVVGKLDDIEMLKTVTNAYGLEAVKKMLYDTAKRHQVSDMLRNVFPFAEAWWEIMTSWLRILSENPQAWRRAQQTIVGARGSGFFETDPETGEEKFNYPGGGLFAKYIFGGGITSGLAQAYGFVPPQGAGPVGIKLQGRVQGLNLVAGQYIPGFGPAIQVPVSHLLNAPRFDAIKRIILPFGEQRISSAASIFTDALPPWAQRFFGGLGLGDPETQRLIANTSIDVYKALVLQGWPDDTPEQRNLLLGRANHIANKISLIRGFAQFFSPTGPEVKFHVIASPDRAVIGDAAADEIEGKLWLFSTLASEYRKAVHQFEGDDVLAYDWFTKHYGLDPTLFAVSKSTQVLVRSVTGEGDRWAREHPGLFDLAPATAYYAHPDDPTGEEFDYAAYLRAIREGAREPLTLEQWVSRRNDLSGRIQYERARREADQIFGVDDSTPKQRALQAMRLWLMDRHPGYRWPNPGTPESAGIDQKIRELREVWPSQVDLAQSDTGQAAALYLRARDEVRRRAVDLELSPDGWKIANSTFAYREALRRYAEYLMERYPDFAHLWQQVLSHEMSDDLELLAETPTLRAA